MIAGTTFDESAGVVTVRYVAGRSRSKVRSLADKAATGRPYGRSWKVSLVPVKHSWNELHEVQKRITSDQSWLPANAALSKWTVDVEHNVVSVGAVEVTPELREAAARTFGDRVELHAEPRAQYFSRTDDWEPWAGGAVIDLPGGQCSTGFPIHDIATGEQRMVTAGHCGDIGTEVFQHGVSMGKISGSGHGHYWHDYAYIKGSTYTPWVYAGGTIKGYSSDLADMAGSVCTDGAFTGQRCTGYVNGGPMCVTFTSGDVTCDLMELSPVDNRQMATYGDSGGPVYRGYNNGVRIYGIIIGGSQYRTYVQLIDQLLPIMFVPMLG